MSKIHGCIVKATVKCKDPTPANVLDSLFIQMRSVTPCPYEESESVLNATGNAPSSFHLSHFLPHILTLLSAALTAANILL